MNHPSSSLILKRLHIDTQIEHVVYMPKDSSVYKSEGFESINRVQVCLNNKILIVSLNIVSNGLLKQGEASLSEGAWKLLGAKEGDEICFSHPKPVESLAFIRAKMYGKELSYLQFDEILKDVVAGLYSNVELSAFIAACAGDHLTIDEIISLSQAMVNTGQKLSWGRKMVIDKHCVGGLPGNRTTPIVVSIAAAAGLTIPKTSSRAITSPAGTADTMETLTRVDLSMDEIVKVVEKENGCFVWGGSVKLSPADDVLIRIERALDVDSVGQMIASVLSKKSAAGSTHVVIDIPVGDTAKVRSMESAEKLKYYFTVVGAALNLKIKVLITDGTQPVGNGIGPSLEAMDVLSVLKNETNAPKDLRDRSLLIAGELLELAEIASIGTGYQLAEEFLKNGSAFKKFEAICKLQGGLKTPHYAKHKFEIKAQQSGIVQSIDNRRLAKIAKLAGAPKELSAGVFMHVKVNSNVKAGDTLFYIYSGEAGELNYALDYLNSQSDIIKLI